MLACYASEDARAGKIAYRTETRRASNMVRRLSMLKGILIFIIHTSHCDSERMNDMLLIPYFL